MNYKEELNKYKKFFYIIGIIYAITLVIFIINKNINKDNIIKDYILSKDFELEDDKIFYKKEISDITYDEYENNKINNINSTYKVLYFDIYTYSLNQHLYDYSNGIETYLTSIYDYRTNIINYTYTINYKTSNIIFKGNFNNNKLTCTNEYAFDAYIDNKDFYCNLIEEYIKDFEDTSIDTITSTKILKYMKK